MAHTHVVVANWKMNPKTLAEAKRLFLDTKRSVSAVRGSRVIICPPAPFLAELQKLYVGKRIDFGGQDVHAEESGAYTGSVSAPMLRSAGARYTIVGHSEQRLSENAGGAGDTNEQVRKKVRAALDARLAVMLCVGERVRDRDGEYLAFVREELVSALKDVARTELEHVMIAYEPIWAIGKSAEDAMDPHDMHQTALFIRKILAELFGRDAANMVPILYGGSVEPDNCAPLIEAGGINGFLVGHASLDPTSFGDILACVFKKRENR